MKSKFTYAIAGLSLLLTPAVGLSQVSLKDAVIKNYSSTTDELRLFAPSCMLSVDPESSAQLEWLAKTDCNLSLYNRMHNTIPTLMFYDSNTGIVVNTPTVFTKKELSLREFVYRYLSDWELTGVDTAAISLSGNWKEASAYAIVKELSSEYFITLDESTKVMHIARKASTSSSDKATSNLHYGLVYEFPDLNLDLYELLKGYLSEASVVYSDRDQKYYILLAKSEKSRETLTKTYSFIRATLDDLLVKSQQVGDYYPKSERDNLQLLSILLSDARIQSFKATEYSMISPEELLPKGLTKYQSYVKRRIAEHTFAIPDASGVVLSPIGDPKIPSLDKLPVPPPLNMAPPAPPVPEEDLENPEAEKTYHELQRR